MDIVSILLGFFGGAIIGGGALFGLQKGKLAEVEQRYAQARQAYDSAEAELKEKNSQLKLFDLSQVRIRELEAKSQEQSEELEQSHHIHQQQLEELEKSQNHLEMMESTYQAQILSLREATPSIEALEHSYQQNLQDYEDQLTNLQQFHTTELEQLQQTHQAQLQDIEQFYQARIEDIEGVYQTQILELQQTNSFREEVQPQSFTEPWDEMVAMADEEEITEISSLEELAAPLEVVDETDGMESSLDDPIVSPISEFEEFIVVTQESFILESDSPELDFLESLEPESFSNLEDLTIASDDFFNTDSISENNFLDLMPTEDEIALEEDQSADLSISADELFNPFETQMRVNGLGYGTGLVQSYHSNDFDSSNSDDELDFLNMLEEEEPEISQSSEEEDLDNVAFDELFSEDLLNANWEATKKHQVDTLES